MFCCIEPAVAVSYNSITKLKIVSSSTVNIQGNFEFDYTLETRDGKQYMVVKNPVTTSTASRSYIHLTNLFNGNELLGKILYKTKICRSKIGKDIDISVLDGNTAWTCRWLTNFGIP